MHHLFIRYVDKSITNAKHAYERCLSQQFGSLRAPSHSCRTKVVQHARPHYAVICFELYLEGYILKHAVYCV